MSIESVFFLISAPFLAASIFVACVNWYLVFRKPKPGRAYVSMFPLFCPCLWGMGVYLSQNSLLLSLWWVGLIIDPASLGGFLLSLFIRQRIG